MSLWNLVLFQKKLRSYPNFADTAIIKDTKIAKFIALRLFLIF